MVRKGTIGSHPTDFSPDFTDEVLEALAEVVREARDSASAPGCYNKDSGDRNWDVASKTLSRFIKGLRDLVEVKEHPSISIPYEVGLSVVIGVGQSCVIFCSESGRIRKRGRVEGERRSGVQLSIPGLEPKEVVFRLVYDYDADSFYCESVSFEAWIENTGQVVDSWEVYRRLQTEEAGERLEEAVDLGAPSAILKSEREAKKNAV